MNSPPLLMGATFLFWGWLTGLWIPGACMALIAECSRLVRLKWDLSPKDFHRIADLCSLLVAGMAVYVYASDPNPRSILVIIQWLPMVSFPLLAAQLYSTRGKVSMGALFWSLRKAQPTGTPPPTGRGEHHLPLPHRMHPLRQCRPHRDTLVLYGTPVPLHMGALVPSIKAGARPFMAGPSHGCWNPGLFRACGSPSSSRRGRKKSNGLVFSFYPRRDRSHLYTNGNRRSGDTETIRPHSFQGQDEVRTQASAPPSQGEL